MENFDKPYLKIRNIALILILIAGILLIFWLIYFIYTSRKELQALLAIGIAFLFAGILLLTRIQYLIWMLKKVKTFSFKLNKYDSIHIKV
ncbi:MAG: hypothetical protein ACFFFB_07390 [Candidatus Heimdallarchaeota archaeon]